jgi:hypothetical protein
MRIELGAVAAILVAGAAQGQEVDKVAPFATQSLRQLTGQVLTSESATRFGFKSLDEAREARVGAPLKVLNIGLASLRKYAPGGGLRSVASESAAVWFPVLVGEQVRSKLELLRKPDGTWATGEFGRPHLAAEVAKAAGVVARKADAPPPQVVKVPALNLVLVHVVGEAGELLVPAVGGFGLTTGTAYPADEALKKLAAAAATADDRQVR